MSSETCTECERDGSGRGTAWRGASKEPTSSSPQNDRLNRVAEKRL